LRLLELSSFDFGRPTKSEPETIDQLLAALADGLTQKQACIASGAILFFA